MPNLIPMDDQPISATFFGEGKWLTDFITPNTLEIQTLHKNITEGIDELGDRLAAMRTWVASKIRYTRFVKGTLQVEGKVSRQNDLWNTPAITAQVGVGNCANMSFLLTSLIRNDLAAQDVHCVLGNLYNGTPGGHAWTQVRLGNEEYILESTKLDIPNLVPTRSIDRYEAVHFFNDKEAYAVEGLTILEPFAACYSTWLKDYLDWAYIKGRK